MNEATMETLLQRLNRVGRENRHLKGVHTLVFVGIAAVVLMGLLAALSPALAQQAQRAPDRDEPATKFEQFLLTKGTIRVREFYEIGRLHGTLQTSTHFEVARAYTPGKKDYVLALRVEVIEFGTHGSRRTRIGVLDAEEVISLAAALPQMSKMLEVLKQGQSAQDTEVDFRGGSLRVGFYVSRKGESKERLFIQAGEIGAVAAFFDVGEFPRLVALISQAAAKIQELRQK